MLAKKLMLATVSVVALCVALTGCGATSQIQQLVNLGSGALDIRNDQLDNLSAGEVQAVTDFLINYSNLEIPHLGDEQAQELVDIIAEHGISSRADLEALDLQQVEMSDELMQVIEALAANLDAVAAQAQEAGLY